MQISRLDENAGVESGESISETAKAEGEEDEEAPERIVLTPRINRILEKMERENASQEELRIAEVDEATSQPKSNLTDETTQDLEELTAGAALTREYAEAIEATRGLLNRVEKSEINTRIRERIEEIEGKLQEYEAKGDPESRALLVESYVLYSTLSDFMSQPIKPIYTWHSLIPPLPPQFAIANKQDGRFALLENQREFTTEGIEIRWNNGLDAEYAEEWPENVVHGPMGYSRNVTPLVDDTMDAQKSVAPEDAGPKTNQAWAGAVPRLEKRRKSDRFDRMELQVAKDVLRKIQSGQVKESKSKGKIAPPVSNQSAPAAQPTA